MCVKCGVLPRLWCAKCNSRQQLRMLLCRICAVAPSSKPRKKCSMCQVRQSTDFRESQCGVCERSLHICPTCAPSALSTSDQQVQMDLCRLCAVKSATPRSRCSFCQSRLSDPSRDTQCGACERSLHICPDCEPPSLSTSDEQVQMHVCRSCAAKSTRLRSICSFCKSRSTAPLPETRCGNRDCGQSLYICSVCAPPAISTSPVLCTTCRKSAKLKSICSFCKSRSTAPLSETRCGNRDCEKSLYICSGCEPPAISTSPVLCTTCWRGHGMPCRVCGVNAQSSKCFRMCCRGCYRQHFCAVCKSPSPSGVDNTVCRACGEGRAIWCASCYSPEQLAAGVCSLCVKHCTDCMHCGGVLGSDVRWVSCTEDACTRSILVCEKCKQTCEAAAASVTVQCFPCWRDGSRGDDGKRCLSCGTAPSRSERDFLHRCKKCITNSKDKAFDSILCHEAHRWVELHEQLPQQTWNGTEPALQLLFVPKRQCDPPISPYDDRPIPLDPKHCRFCFKGLAPTGTLPKGAGDIVDASTLVPARPEDPVQCGLFVSGGSADNVDICVDDAEYLLGHEDEDVAHENTSHLQHTSVVASSLDDSSLARHLREGCEGHVATTPAKYRESVLEDALDQWPQKISPQLLRARLAGFKAELTDLNYKMQPCACCAREKRPIKLSEVVFPARDASDCPTWLPFTATDWEKHREAWYDRIDSLFNIEVYLDTVFHVSTRKNYSERDVANARDGNRTVFTTLEAAEAWSERLRVWEVNLRASLRADSVPAPGNSGARWLFYIPSLMNATPDDMVSRTSLTCKLCKKCLEPLRRCTPCMPRYARANFMWLVSLVLLYRNWKRYTYTPCYFGRCAASRVLRNFAVVSGLVTGAMQLRRANLQGEMSASAEKGLNKCNDSCGAVQSQQP